MTDLLIVLVIFGIPLALVLFLRWGGQQPWWPSDGGP